MPSVYNYLTTNRGILRSIGLKKNSQKPIINSTLKLNDNNTESIPETIASTASLATTVENYNSEYENNNPKINTKEINIYIHEFVNTNQIPELNDFKNQWKTFSDDQKKEFIKRIKNVVESEHLLNYLQNYNKNIGKNNDTRFITVLKLLDLLIQGHNRNRYESVEINYSNNSNKLENLIYKLKHINYTPGNISNPQFISDANKFINYQLIRAKLPQINKLDNKQKNELIFFLLDNKSFKGLLNTWKPTKKDYFAWLDKTFGI